MFGFLINTTILFIVELNIIAAFAKRGVQLIVVVEDLILGKSLFAPAAYQISVLAMDV